MRKHTSIGIFAEWIVDQIPQYIDKKISAKVKSVKSGINGKDGVSVVDAEIAVDDHLVLKLSDGKIIDAGELPSIDAGKIQQIVSTQTARDQITVSATAPQNPQVNDLWLDIS